MLIVKDSRIHALTPKYSDIPLNKSELFKSAMDDQLGFLNRLTHEIALEAAKDIGDRNTNLSQLASQRPETLPLLGRQVFHQNLYTKPPHCVNNDKKFYNGVTMDDIHGPNRTNVNGKFYMLVWSEKPIVDRGIPLDYYSWRIANNIPYEPFKTGFIPLAHLKATAKSQNVQIKFGDTLLIRSGYIAVYNVKSTEELVALANQKVYLLHEMLLAGWRCPIGELFDLEALSEQCKGTGRYSFLVTGEVPGGVASSPNILTVC
ncbi:hypothetical protein K469DRAFT_735878 [Zopfia rhizophila CBS 207.26]|uniref:Uncharacterized protein n=1 Tax=Zopfia rhizophila CBS 207.26 TaxID=1314779 RepID=A0A6A6EFX7_9PEZI|nr:hypothetical protein K469DRAFT_735878 [Zopfia rhizophila CBS 207.26]